VVLRGYKTETVVTGQKFIIFHSEAFRDPEQQSRNFCSTVTYKLTLILINYSTITGIIFIVITNQNGDSVTKFSNKLTGSNHRSSGMLRSVDCSQFIHPVYKDLGLLDS
jgi:hypothetical protein